MRTKQTEAATDRLISKERLKRLTHQNEKLKIEMQRLRGEVGPIEDFKHVVLRANSVVKLQILSVPIRVGPTLGLTREQIAGLNQALTDSLNDLAFNDELKLQPEICPICGRGKREESADGPRKD